MLNRYLFGHYARLCGLFFAIFLLLAFFINTSSRISQFSYLDISLSQIALLSLFQIPAIISKLLPFLTLFAAMAHFLKLNHDREIIIIRNSGFSIWYIIKPSCVLAALMGLAAIFILHPLSLWSYQKKEKLLHSWHETNKNMPIEPQNFWLLEKNAQQKTAIGASYLDLKAAIVYDASFSVIGRGQEILRYEAARAELKSGYWLLPKARIYQIGKPPLTGYNKKIASRLNQSQLAEIFAQAQNVSFFDLLAKAKIAEAFGYSGAKFRSLFYNLLALPLLLIAMIALAAASCLGFSRYGQAKTVLVCAIAFGFLTYFLTMLCLNLGEQEIITPFFAGFLPVICSFLLSLPLLILREEA